MLALVIVLVVIAASAALLWYFADALVAAKAGVRPPEPVERQRLEVYTEAVCLSAGFPEAAIGVIDDPAPGALAYGRRRTRGNAVVTTGLLESFSPVELEAVAAHLLCRIKMGAARRDTYLAVLRMSVYPFGKLLEVFFPDASRSALGADAAAVRITRFPQAMISALKQMEALSVSLKRQPASIRRLWMYDPSRDPVRPGDVTAADRITYLADSRQAVPSYVEPGERILHYTPKGRTPAGQGNS